MRAVTLVMYHIMPDLMVQDGAKERLYTILGEDGIYNEKKLAEFQQKHSVVTTIILNIPRLPEEGVLNAEKK